MSANSEEEHLPSSGAAAQLLTDPLSWETPAAQRARRHRVAAEAAFGLASGWFAALVLGVDGTAVARLALVVWLVATCWGGLDPFDQGRGAWRLLRRRGTWACSGVAFVLTLADVSRTVARDSVVVLASATATAVVVSLVWPRARPARRLLLVGERRQVQQLAATLRASDPSSCVVAACVVTTGAPTSWGSSLPVPTCAQLHAVPVLARATGAEHVLVVPGPGLPAKEIRKLAWSLENTGAALHVAWSYDWVAPRRVVAGAFGHAGLIHLGSTSRPGFVRAAKSGTDRTVALLLLLILAPLLAVLWALVRLTSEGPGFFRQTRIGLHGRPFDMYKLRTMCVDAETLKSQLSAMNEMDATLFKIREDPRVTPLGRFLRRLSLDELPQLFNVLRGDMSLVGPRPALPDEVATYDETARRRLAVKPGITGLWQVSGRSDLTWEDSIRLDLHYTDNWSLGGDLVIAARTVSAVTKARGAY